MVSTQVTGVQERFVMAARQGDLKEMHVTFRQGADPQLADERSSSTPLHHAAVSGQIDAVLELVDIFSVAVDPKNRADSTPLAQAATEGHTEVVRLLAKHGADVHGAARLGKTTPLHSAAYFGHADTIFALLELGASANVKAGGNSPVDLARKGMESASDKTSFERAIEILEAATKTKDEM